MSIANVIGWKFNNQAGMSTKGDVITEFPNGIPTQADQDLWTTEYNAHLASAKYIADRQAEYPPIEDYLDGIVKGDTVQVDKYIADCQAVKTKYPKQ